MSHTEAHCPECGEMHEALAHATQQAEGLHEALTMAGAENSHLLEMLRDVAESPGTAAAVYRARTHLAALEDSKT